MSTYDCESASAGDINHGLDPNTGLPNNAYSQNPNLFGQPPRHAPTAILPAHQLLNQGEIDDGTVDALTGLSTEEGRVVGQYGDEFESGIAAIDQGAYFVGSLMDKVDDMTEQAIAASTPAIRETLRRATTEFSNGLQDALETTQSYWNEPNNELRHTLDDRFQNLLHRFRQESEQIAAHPDVQEAIAQTKRLGSQLLVRMRETLQTAQVNAKRWVDEIYSESYVGASTTGQRNGGDRSTDTFTGIIDTGFTPGDHGTEVAHILEQASQDDIDWFSRAIGTGEWSADLVSFVDAVKAAGREQAVINLSFDLTQTHADGTITTRFHLTPAERQALAYAQENGVLIIAAAGNEASILSALGQASQEFDNIITVGAVEQGQRADYSSYGAGLSLVASGNGRGDLEGTSLAAARVSAAASQIWEINPSLNYRQVIHILQSTAVDLQEEGWDAETAFGKLDVDAARTLAQATLHNPQLLADTDLNQRLTASDRTPTFTEQRAGGAIASERPATNDSELSADSLNPMFEAMTDLLHVESYIPSNADELLDQQSDTLQDFADLDEELQPALEISIEGPLRYGDGFGDLEEEKRVQEWQRFLNSQGLSMHLNEDGDFGANTKAMTMEFQAEQGNLAVDGIVGRNTRAAALDAPTASHSSSQIFPGYLLKYTPGEPLTFDPAVAAWQARMQARGWNITVDGLYGPHSAEVARQFQAEKRLSVDGIVGEQTWAAAFGNTNVTNSTNSIENPSFYGDNSSFRNRVVAIAREQWEYFSRGVLKEYQHAGSDRVGEYWESVGQNLTGYDTSQPWSAAFISWVMQQAGAGLTFDYSARHANYINQAIRNRQEGNNDAAFVAYAIGEYAPKPGDLIGRNRGAGVTFNSARETGDYASHTDIVVAVRPGEIDVIGGNVSDSVTLQTIRTDAQGRILNDNSTTTDDWFVVIANQLSSLGSDTSELSSQASPGVEVTIETASDSPGVAPETITNEDFNTSSEDSDSSGSESESEQPQFHESSDSPEADTPEEGFYITRLAEGWSIKDIISDSSYEAWREAIGKDGYDGGGFIENPENGERYPIVIPTVYDNNGELRYTAEGGGRPQELEPVSTLGGKDPGWVSVDWLHGTEVFYEPKFWDRLVFAVPVAGPNAPRVQYVEEDVYNHLVIPSEGMPWLAWEPQPVDTGGTAKPLAEGLGTEEIKYTMLIRERDGTLTAVNNYTPGSLSRPEQRQNSYNPLTSAQSTRGARVQGGVDLATALLQGGSNASNLEEMFRYRYEVSFEENIDGRRRAIIRAFRLSPIVDPGDGKNKIQISKIFSNKKLMPLITQL
jgi:hypothetical protein